MAEVLWTWCGAFFGRRDGNVLWTRDGRHVAGSMATKSSGQTVTIWASFEAAIG